MHIIAFKVKNTTKYFQNIGLIVFKIQTKMFINYSVTNLINKKKKCKLQMPWLLIIMI